METSGTPLKKIPQRGEAPGEFREETPSRCDPNDQRGECSDRRDRRDSIFAGRSAARPDLFGALHGVAPPHRGRNRSRADGATRRDAWVGRRVMTKAEWLVSAVAAVALAWMVLR